MFFNSKYKVFQNMYEWCFDALSYYNYTHNFASNLIFCIKFNIKFTIDSCLYYTSLFTKQKIKLFKRG